jgi:chlorophyll synthase
VAAVVMLVPQLVVVALHLHWGNRLAAAAVAALVLAQAAQMPMLMRDPKRRAPLYGATGVTLYVTGMMVSAFAVR